MPEGLKLVLDLPTSTGANKIELDLTEDNAVLDAADLFYLELPLPYKVDDTFSFPGPVLLIL